MSLGDSTSGAAGGGAAQIADARQLLASTFERELATTRRLLAQYPQDKGELQPHPKLKVARELAWLLVMEQRLCLGAIAGTLDMATAFSPAPANFG